MTNDDDDDDDDDTVSPRKTSINTVALFHASLDFALLLLQFFFSLKKFYLII
jgi:hypothetical protein